MLGRCPQGSDGCLARCRHHLVSLVGLLLFGVWWWRRRWRRRRHAGRRRRRPTHARGRRRHGHAPHPNGHQPHPARQRPAHHHRWPHAQPWRRRQQHAMTRRRPAQSRRRAEWHAVAWRHRPVGHARVGRWRGEEAGARVAAVLLGHFGHARLQREVRSARDGGGVAVPDDPGGELSTLLGRRLADSLSDGHLLVAEDVGAPLGELLERTVDVLVAGDVGVFAPLLLEALLLLPLGVQQRDAHVLLHLVQPDLLPRQRVERQVQRAARLQAHLRRVVPPHKAVGNDGGCRTRHGFRLGLGLGLCLLKLRRRLLLGRPPLPLSVFGGGGLLLLLGHEVLRLWQALLVVEADGLHAHEVVPVDGHHGVALGVLHRPLAVRRAVPLAHEARILLDARERAQPVVAVLEQPLLELLLGREALGVRVD
mmetsp:Transcript_5635/g.13095  ORF Transcript_5635/g.13095 Transcript_5635/m.13095 type:complete len:423 (+) Transcript_5635:103-1371(+)